MASQAASNSGRPVDEYANSSWLGLLSDRHEGIVVTATALDGEGIFADANVSTAQSALLELVDVPDAARGRDDHDEVRELRKAIAEGRIDRSDVRLPSLGAFCQEVLGWRETDLSPLEIGDERDLRWSVYLPQHDDTLRATHVVMRADDPMRALMLVRVERPGTDFDAAPSGTDAHAVGWRASPEQRFERLLQEAGDGGVPIGLLFNGAELRIVYAPKDETAGHLTFPIAAMCEVPGRPILAGLATLLRQERLFLDKPVLPALLARSRRVQNEVSSALGKQVLEALNFLVAGLQAANEAAPEGRGTLLHEALADDPNHLYGGLLTVILRLVFVLYAEDRGLLSDSPVFTKSYSVMELHARLQADDGLYAGQISKRFGAWSQLLTLFRMLHDGARAPGFHLPPRAGRLFDPDAYAFLEGRRHGTRRVTGDRIVAPLISDGVVYEVLQRLMYLKGERLSYRTLDVEQIGSVYEGMMGFTLEEAKGWSVAVDPHDVVVNLDAVLAAKPEARAKIIGDADCKLADVALKAWKSATTVDALVDALGKKASERGKLPPESLFLQPTEERRRSGSHYTPRALTQPIVEKTLRPQIDRLLGKTGRTSPTAAEILSLKVCDPAMGSGAFLVEACRFLATALVTAWSVHGERPEIPADETPELHARRVVAQRCLYGVDKNPFAVDLGKLSLWLFTLAKEHPFTFLDHALRRGDSLVGLGREAIASFDWKTQKQASVGLIRPLMKTVLATAEAKRAGIHALGDSNHVREKSQLLREADDEIAGVRAIADLCVLAFFSSKTAKAREQRRREFTTLVEGWIAEHLPLTRLLDEARALEDLLPAVETFHWELEYPEVFSRDNAGFDAFVGNPPFLGGKRISTISGDAYKDWLAALHDSSNSNSDLVAHFFRRAFTMLRSGGTFGLIATNTIAQGDTRGTGLRWICKNGGALYDVTRRYAWPGLAAVIVSVVHGVRASSAERKPLLDGREVERISAFLFHQGGDDNPDRLGANQRRAFVGSYVLGMGFTFDDENLDKGSSPTAEMHRLVAKNSRNSERIFPYFGGEELNASPTHAHARYVIDFGNMSETDARGWPELLAIVEAKVRPERLRQNDPGAKRLWWQFVRPRPELHDAIKTLNRVLVRSLTSKHFCFAFQHERGVLDQTLIVFAYDQPAAFALLSCRVHEAWATFFGATMKDDPRYNIRDCFDTFPFPPSWSTNEHLESTGRAYYEYRAALMVENNQGLTATYNRFHDEDEHDPKIEKLRELHAAMDRAVLDAYGWKTLPTACEFILDYAVAEDEAGKKRKKKPTRLRWPDAVRDDVLAKLIALNLERAAEERKAGIVVTRAVIEGVEDGD